ncbi:uncharacterized protein [Parasteatoda tepidariorum]|uniref:uncharacterized protein n=1 Tax=Parasteatoda tepidariorum TaxID=114398 RepID=UPI00077F87B0|nr:BTB and MATH domain-containing protein 42-like [Parasteatoda tepidariorum]
MDLYVQILYSDGDLFHQYKPLRSINAAEIDTIHFDDLFSPLRSLYFFNSNHYNKMLTKTLILECHFHFFNSGSSAALLRDCELQSLDNLQAFNQGLGRFYKSYFKFDVSFKVGNRILPAHKFILSAHSPVFKKMMTDISEEHILLHDVPFEAFDCFLKYMYTGEIEDESWPTVKELYVLSKKYEVQTLTRECSHLITSSFSFNQVCEILKLAYIYGDKELKQISKQYAITHYRKLISKKEWKELISSYPEIGHEIMNDVILKSHCESDKSSCT